MPHPIDIKTGAVVRATRLARGLSQAELSDALGISFQQVQKYESGNNRLSVSRLWEIAQALDTDLGALIGQVEDQDQASEMPKHVLRLAGEILKIESPQVRQHILRLIQACSATDQIVSKD